MKKNLFVLIFLCFVYVVSANIFPICYNGKYGYIDENLTVYTQPQYDEATEFIDGIAVVKENDLYHIINDKFSILATVDADSVKLPAEGVIPFEKDEIWFYTDFWGNIMVNGFTCASSFSNGLAIVGLSETEYCIINNKMENICNIFPANIDIPIVNNRVFIRSPQNYLIALAEITANGLKLCTEYTFFEVNEFIEGIAAVTFDKDGKSFSTWIDINGNIITSKSYLSTKSFINGYACVKEKQYDEISKQKLSFYEIIDKNFNVISKFPYGINILTHFKNNLCLYIQFEGRTRTYGIISVTGEYITKNVIDKDVKYINGFLEIQINNKNFLINKNGDVIPVTRIFGY